MCYYLGTLETNKKGMYQLGANHTCRKPIRIGEVYYMKFSGEGSEQSGWRPGLVYQNNTGNDHSPNIIALPFTTSIKKAGQPTHVVVPAGEGMPRDSMILCENPERMSKDRIGSYITTLSDDIMAEVAAASILSSSVISYIKPEVLVALWKKAVALNEVSR